MANGVATGGTATVTHVGNGATITLQGDLVTDNGTLIVTMADATGTSDVLNLVAKTTITQIDNGPLPANVDTTAATITVGAAGVETVNFTSTGKLSAAPAVGNIADNAQNTLVLVDSSLKTLNITGDQSVVYVADAGSTKLVSVDASGNTGTAAASFDVSASGKAVTVLGELNAKDTIIGSGQADTITGGAKADTITGGLGGDTMTGGAGNDTFVYTASADSTLLNLDTIKDFTANTWGQGITSGVATGAATSAGADATSAKLNGDLIDLTTIVTANTDTDIKVGVQSNASDAQTFLQNLAHDVTLNDGTHKYLGAALDSSSGNLYLDVDANGTADMVIHLTGVTTLTEAAFVI
jgi:Ca2+-binding RTX toxin-like protein